MKQRDILNRAASRGIEYRENVGRISPHPKAEASVLRALFDTGLPEDGRGADEVLDQLADAAEQGLVGSTGDAFFGWVMGASHPIGIAADWLTSAWGQNSAIYQTAPAAAIAEEVAGEWLIDLLRLPPQSSIAFTTGATMASFICLAAARGEVLRRHGWDLEAKGQFGAPEVRVFVSEEAHSSIFADLRYLGFGHERLKLIKVDQQGHLLIDDLEEKVAGYNGPAIVIAQAGHINTGACDDFQAIHAIAKSSNAWLHVDGAFGLWAQSSAKLSFLCKGVDLADSWAVDGHKWLQVPYESGFAIVKDKVAHCRAMATTAGYLNETPEDGRNPTYYGPELSRRARGFTVWAVLQHLGRNGVSDIVDGNVANARQLAASFAKEQGIRVLHEVYLNQVTVNFEDEDGYSQALSQRMVQAVQKNKHWFVKEADWRGQVVLRFSFSSMTKTEAQIDELSEFITQTWRSLNIEAACLDKQTV